jgi:4-amino-4-deoxy-L-arabinose transferase-like glycosyltransferase
MGTLDNSSSWHSWLKVASTIVIIIAIWVTRVTALDRPVTVDEDRWAARAANFFSALDRGEFAKTFQKEHPGVTTMWAGAAGLLWRFPDYSPGNAGQVDVSGYLDVLEERGHTVLQMIAAGRFFMVLANTIALALAYIFAQRLLGLAPVFLGFLLIAFDPFHVAHSRLLHLDGLLSSLLLLALLAFLSFGQERRVSALIASGVAAGLSWLTKSPGLFLIPTVVLLSALDALNNRSLRSLARLPALVWQFAWPLILWGLVAIVVFVALWPAMWVDPLGTLSGILAPALSHASEGHPYPIFFNGQIYADGQVDTPTFYPISYLWRSTPVVLVGILIAAMGFVFRREPLNDPKTRCAVLGLVLFVVVFTTLQNLGAKKFDRYLLPVFLPLNLIAAVGWVTLARWLTSGRFTHMRRHAVSLLLVVLVAVQAIGTFWTFPYFLSYYNPLLGGSRKAPEVMTIGWGEGLDQAARYLNEKPNAHNLRVLTWYPQSFYPYFVGTTGFIIQQPGITKAQLEEMLEWHYAVLYIHQWQRQMPIRLLDHLAKQTPVHSIWINGLEYARIYKLISVPEPPVPSKLVTEGNLGNMARLVGYDPSPPLLATAGTTLPLTLTWEATGIFDQDYTVFIHLVGGDKRPLAQADGQPVGGDYATTFWDVGQRLGDPHQLLIPSDLPPGEYELLVGMYLLSTGERLPLLGADGQVLGDSISLGQVTVTQP